MKSLFKGILTEFATYLELDDDFDDVGEMALAIETACDEEYEDVEEDDDDDDEEEEEEEEKPSKKSKVKGKKSKAKGKKSKK